MSYLITKFQKLSEISKMIDRSALLCDWLEANGGFGNLHSKLSHVTCLVYQHHVIDRLQKCLNDLPLSLFTRNWEIKMNRISPYVHPFI